VARVAAHEHKWWFHQPRRGIGRLVCMECGLQGLKGTEDELWEVMLRNARLARASATRSPGELPPDPV
jgi:hypothetical protein